LKSIRLARPRRPRGQSVVEFALILPVMLILLAAAIDMGRLFYSYVAVENAAKEGAFFGSRNPLCDDATSASCGNPNNVIWHVQNEAPNIGSGFTTSVACRDLAGSLVQPINNCLDGFKYQVTVTYPFQMITPILSTILGNTLTLHSEAQATVVNDAFDPSGLEALVWVNTSGSENGAAITGACTPADPASSPGFFYQPCQDSSNVDNFLQFHEHDASNPSTISYKVRVRNTGNTNLTGITYVFKVNGTTITTPGTCGTLPTSMNAAAAPAYCTFTRQATYTAPGDLAVSLTAQGNVSGLSAGQTTGIAAVKVIPSPRLVVNLRVAPYRLGGQGNGLAGAPTYVNGPLTLKRSTSGSLPTEIQNPTGWLYLTIVNQGGQANNFNLSVTQNGTQILPAECPVPASLAAAGNSGDTFVCLFPRTFTTTGAFNMVATPSATNMIIAGGQTSVTITTDQAACTSGQAITPNLVDTLTPTADETNKTVGQSKAIYSAAGFTGAVTTTPGSALDSWTSLTQNRTAYTCNSTSQSVTIGAAP